MVRVSLNSCNEGRPSLSTFKVISMLSLRLTDILNFSCILAHPHLYLTVLSVPFVRESAQDVQMTVHFNFSHSIASSCSEPVPPPDRPLFSPVALFHVLRLSSLIQLAHYSVPQTTNQKLLTMSSQEPTWFCHEVRLGRVSFEALQTKCLRSPVRGRNEAADGAAASCSSLSGMLIQSLKVPDPHCASCNGTFVEKVPLSHFSYD